MPASIGISTCRHVAARSRSSRAFGFPFVVSSVLFFIGGSLSPSGTVVLNTPLSSGRSGGRRYCFKFNTSVGIAHRDPRPRQALISRTSPPFRAAFGLLPKQIQTRARAAYRIFRENPSHPSLRFKNVHPTRPIYSARVGLAHRVLGIRHGDVIIWFWIGSHAEYDQILRNL